MKIETILLDNGVHILTERLTDVRTCSIGVYISNGSRHEDSSVSGISHCIEHMVFKGTRKRTAAQIAEDFDRLGGQSNAYTTKEMTCFYATCLSRSVIEAADLLADMVTDPKMADDDLGLERNVIFEEIDMCEDTPEDLVCELISQNSFPNCSAGRPILGQRNTLKKLTGSTLLEYLHAHYTGENVYVALSGSFLTSDVAHIKELFSHIPRGKRNVCDQTVYTPSLTVRKKQIEQVHLCLCYPGISSVAPERFALRLLNTVFGDGMSSRLFQRLREKDSLCYAVGAFPAAVSDCGVYEIYTATGPEKQTDAIEAILEETEHMIQDGVTEDELSRAKETTEAGLLISLENTGARAGLMAKNQMYFHAAPDIDAILEAYRSVTREEITDLARRIFSKDKLSFAAVGDTLSPTVYESIV